jgi:hypothetical protein
VRAELARTQLLYGEWPRRVKRRLDARERLRAGHDLFGSMGMDAFAERARNELHATGENVRKGVDETHDDLNAQERAKSRGSSAMGSPTRRSGPPIPEPEHGERHLRHVFTKLGSRSRGQLEAALAGDVRFVRRAAVRLTSRRARRSGRWDAVRAVWC